MSLDEARAGQASSYLDHLPAIFREAPEEGEPGFLGRFLLAFEHLLTGVGNPGETGLDEQLDRVAELFDPQRTPAAFLDWLAGWVALTLRGDLDADEGREVARGLVADAVPLYRLRGTRRGLEKLIRRLTGGLSPTITEPRPNFFHVMLRLSHPDPRARRRVVALVRSIVDLEKPAHTRYSLEVRIPAMQLGTPLQIGVNTLLAPTDTPGDP